MTRIQKQVTIGTAIILFGLIAYVIYLELNQPSPKPQGLTPAQIATIEAKKTAKEQAQKTHFSLNRNQIVRDIQILINSNDNDGAVTLSEKYLKYNDSEIQKLHDIAEEKRSLRASLKE